MRDELVCELHHSRIGIGLHTVVNAWSIRDIERCANWSGRQNGVQTFCFLRLERLVPSGWKILKASFGCYFRPGRMQS
jgi:hypothetical protein